MTETLKFITDEYSLVYFIRQVMTVFTLFFYGLMLVVPLNYRKNRTKALSNFWMLLLSFPMGLSVFIATGFMLLINGKSYLLDSCLGIMAVVLIAVYFFCEPDFNELFDNIKIKKIKGIINIILVMALVILIVLFSTSGILSIIYSNDSMYYYNAYPRELVLTGLISARLDTFLTDSGQGTAIINTIPYLIGFNESFGIQHFFNINFILVYFYAIFECCERRFGGNRVSQKKAENSEKATKTKVRSFVISTVFTLLLVTSMPFVILSKWAIANVYFMETGFICVYLAYKMKRDKMENIFILAPLMFMFSTLRIEAAIFCGFILMCFIYAGFKKGEIVFITLPIIVVHSMYYYRIFWYMYLKSTYTFMTKEKSIIAIVFLISIIIYSFVKDAADIKLKSDSIGSKFVKLVYAIFANPLIVTLFALICVNIGLFVYDHNVYIVNIKSFIRNILNQSGWGFFAAIIFILMLLVPKKKIRSNYFDFVYIGFVLMVIALCFARGGDLRESFADSGNRVLLQVVPFVLFAFTFRFIETMNVTAKEHKETEHK